MSLQTNLKGSLRNTSLPKSHGLMPVFGAVVKSIQSIKEKRETASRKVTLQVNRSQQSSLDLDIKSLPPIVGFTIVDNVCGFDEEKFLSAA